MLALETFKSCQLCSNYAGITLATYLGEANTIVQMELKEMQEEVAALRQDNTAVQIN